MKKALLAVTLFLSLVMLCSCRVNWFGETVDAPWYLVVIPVLLILVISYIVLIRRTYVCSACHTVFRPKWYQVSVCLHFGGKRALKCPVCGKKGFFEREK